ncbi:MAG TPA: hypothetical protein VLJ80_04965 [Solirubrobacteraceae bacterium]|nr:hypothetical protein [Solirubrobacteraceae bacterium]
MPIGAARGQTPVPTAKALVPLLALAFSIALAAPPRAHARAPLTDGVYVGVVTPGVGAGGIELGMSRAQVIARLGRPFVDLDHEFMEYARSHPGDGSARGEYREFDLYLRDGRVTSIAIGNQPGFHLATGERVSGPGAISALRRRFGHRLKAVHGLGGPLYRIVDRRRGKIVWTDFSTPRFGPHAKITSVDIVWPLPQRRAGDRRSAHRPARAPSRIGRVSARSAH